MDQYLEFENQLLELKLLVNGHNNNIDIVDIRNKVHGISSSWKSIKTELDSTLLELTALKEETNKSNEIFKLKLLTSPPPYNSSAQNLFQRRVLVKSASEVEILKERNKILERSLSESLVHEKASNNYLKIPLDGYNTAEICTQTTPPIGPDAPPILSTIRQKGSEKNLELFKEINCQAPLKTVNALVLSYIEIDTKLMFSSLTKCPNLSILKFNKVLFKGVLNQRVELPLLKEFSISQTSPKLLCESKNLTRDAFRSLLFFGDWEISELLNQNLTSIELNVEGWTQFKINQENGEFISRLSFSSEILNGLNNANSKFTLKRLSLQACKFEVSLLAPPAYMKSLIYVNLQSILTTTSSLTQIFKAATSLQQLILKNYIDSTGISLSEIPSKVKHLCLGLCTFTMYIRHSPGVTFKNLDTLIFPTNIMDSEILENLSKIFNSRKVILYLCQRSTPIKNGYFLLNELLEMESVEWIWISNFKRSYFEDVDRVIYKNIESILVNAGLKDMDQTSYILEKIKDNEGKLKWIGRNISAEEHQVQEFQIRDGYKFCNWEAYSKRY